EKSLRSALADPRPLRLGPSGWADVARGVDPQVAEAREVSGYYALQAERDALAAMVGAGPTRPPGPPPRKRVPASPPAGPPLRRRKPGAAPPPTPLAISAPVDRTSGLTGLLAEVGPRRDALAARLGLSEAAMLARFRAAGLERELALRERDLIRALWS